MTESQVFERKQELYRQIEDQRKKGVLFESWEETKKELLQKLMDLEMENRELKLQILTLENSEGSSSPEKVDSN